MASAMLVWNPDTDSIENYYAADHVHGTTGVCLKNRYQDPCPGDLLHTKSNIPAPTTPSEEN